MRFEISRGDAAKIPSDEQIREAAGKLLEREDVILPDGVVEVKLCDTEEMLELNRTHRRSDAVTDVLAFEMLDEDPESGELIVGSIAVNHDLAAARARDWLVASGAPEDRFDHLFAAETLLYVLHGLLHFAGYDDEFPEDRREMFDIAAEVLSSLGHTVIPYSLSGKEE